MVSWPQVIHRVGLLTKKTAEDPKSKTDDLKSKISYRGSYLDEKAHFDDEEILTIYLDQISDPQFYASSQNLSLLRQCLTSQVQEP